MIHLHIWRLVSSSVPLVVLSCFSVSGLTKERLISTKKSKKREKNKGKRFYPRYSCFSFSLSRCLLWTIFGANMNCAWAGICLHGLGVLSPQTSIFTSTTDFHFCEMMERSSWAPFISPGCRGKDVCSRQHKKPCPATAWVQILLLDIQSRALQSRSPAPSTGLL